MTNQYGFIKSKIKPQDYVFGDAQLQSDILQPDGQWDAFLPTDEFQNQGFEIYACATFGTLNCVETILKRRFNFNDNFSDRYVATLTDTGKIHGNDPQKIAEFIRKNGDVDESVWPYLNTTFDDYYQAPPTSLASKASVFNAHYDFKHDIVPSDSKSMMTALKYSPLGISVEAWADRGDGIMQAGDGAHDNHWCMCYGYKENEYWKVFDSYDNTHKKVEWAHRPVQAKRYHIDLAPQTTSFLQSLWSALLQALNIIQRVKDEQANESTDPPSPVKPPPVSIPAPLPKLLIPFCQAIKDREGWFKGSRSYRNNNPGNLRYVGQPGAKPDSGSYAIFTTYQAGWIALVTMVQNAASGKSKVYHPTMTILEFFQVFAPSQDSNDPHAYALYVAKRLSVDASVYQIKNLIA